MALEIVRRIHDNLHGSIDITELEDKVIAHKYFQRLRRVKQTAFLSYVFPGASHSRFEHSLGVMHLAGRAWKKIQDNQRVLKRQCEETPEFEKKERNLTQTSSTLSETFVVMKHIFSSDYIQQTLRLAALLHDVGHAPMSHSCEKFLPSYKQIVEKIKKESNPSLREYLSKKASQSKKTDNVSHEVFSLLIIEAILHDIYKENSDIKLKVDPQDILSVLSPQISPNKDSELLTHGVHKLCHELVSGDIDVDRFDYLQRDSRECGVVYGLFDLDRIMDCLVFYYEKERKSYHLGLKFSGLDAFENYLRARQSMYVQIYFHKTTVSCEAMLDFIRKKIPEWRLPAALSDYIKLDETNIQETMLAAAHKSIITEKEKQKLKDYIKNLFSERKLWKTAYEVIENSKEISEQEDLKLVMKLLEENKIDYCHISSKSSLIKLKNGKNSSSSLNQLKLIKKDSKQFTKVVSFEDYSLMSLASNSFTQIDRIYVAENALKAVRKVLQTKFWE